MLQTGTNFALINFEPVRYKGAAAARKTNQNLRGKK